MGHKVNPIGFRIGINRTWDSRWYANTREYGDLLHEDLKIRAYIKKECAQAGVSRVIIERPHRKCRVTIHTARPGVIIGKKGADIEKLRQKVASMTDSELHLNIVEIRRPELDALTLHVTGHGPARRLDLAGVDPVGLERLEAVGAEVQVRAALGLAMDAALVLLAEFRSLWRKHGSVSSSGQRCGRPAGRPPTGRPAPLSCNSCWRRSRAEGSCSMTSPLKIHTLTPQMP